MIRTSIWAGLLTLVAASMVAGSAIAKGHTEKPPPPKHELGEHDKGKATEKVTEVSDRIEDGGEGRKPAKKGAVGAK